MEKLTETVVRDFVKDWYDALDRHDPIELVLPYLAHNGLAMKFPEATLQSLDDFRQWYETVIHRFFDEVHVVKQVEVQFTSPVHADVLVIVNWQARVWDPPAAHSDWLGFDATQSWSIVLQDGAPRIRDYSVDDLAPMPGSASL